MAGVLMGPGYADRFTAPPPGTGAYLQLLAGRLSREPVTEPIERVRTAWEAAERDRDGLRDLAIGETRAIRIGDAVRPMQS